MKGKLISFFTLIILTNSWNALSQSVGIDVDIIDPSTCSQNGMFIANTVGLVSGDTSYWQLKAYPNTYLGPSLPQSSDTFDNLTSGTYTLNLFYKTLGDTSFNIDSTVVYIKRESYYFDTVVIGPIDSMGNFKVLPNLFITSTGSCVDTITVFPDSINCSNGLSQSIVLSIKENDGNIYDETVTVNLIDLIAPNVRSKNITASIDSFGNLQINPSDINDGSSDNCEVLLSVSPSLFTCVDLGVNSIVLSGTDQSGNTSSDTSTLTIVDDIAPIVICQTKTIFLDSSGNATLLASDIDNGSSDNCSSISFSLSKSSFNCSNIGVNTVVLTGTDASGNSSSCSTMVTILDNIAPTMKCKSVTVSLNPSGIANLTISDIDDGSTDNCSGINLTLSKSNFNCSNIGFNSVVLTGTDPNGNTSSCVTTVTVIDNYPPTILCKPVTVYLDASGNGVINTADLNNGSSDNCTVINLTLSKSSFNCSNIGANTVVLTGTDASGNTSNCSSIITVIDTISPSIITRDITVNLNASNNAIITTADIDNGSYDNCTPITLLLSKTNFNCSDVGLNQITLTGTDDYGNSGSNIANVIVVDNLAPTAACKPSTIYLNALGSATLNPADINDGSSDNCSNQLSLSQTTFNCSSLGNNTVTLTVSDDQGLSSTCTTTVNVVDLIPPTIICKPIVISLDGSGNSTINAADINDGSYDNCSSISYSLSKSSFNCSNIGVNTVVLTGTDASGNSSSCSTMVTVLDNIAPTMKCKPVTVSLNPSGIANITISDIDDGSTDNCSGINLTLSKSNFNCSNIGVNSVVLTGTDPNGNTSSCVTTVTVIDNYPPTILCKPVTVYLDASGNGVINTADLNNGSSDNCTVINLTLSKSSFNCSNIGANTVVLTGTDVSGNTSNCSSIVTVIDTSGPTTAIISSSSSSICRGSSTVLSTSLGPGYSYSWNDGSGIIGTSQTIMVSPDSTTIYTATITSSSGCISTSVNDTIDVIPIVPSTITGPNEICVGDTAVLTANLGTNYLWSNGDTTQSINVNPSSSTSYSVSVTNNGCQSTSPISTISVNQLPNVNVGNDQTICANSSIALSATGANSFSWSPSSGLNSTSIANPIANPLSTTIYKVIGTDINGCKNEDQLTLTVTNLPNPSINGEDTVCQNSYFNSYTSSPTTNILEWTAVNGNIQGYLGGTNNPLIHWYNNSSPTQLILKETKPGSNCKNSDTLSIVFINDTALDPVRITSLNTTSNILVASINYPVMNWGMESKLTRNPIYLNQNGQYCQYAFIDTINYYYWVEIGNGNNCLTKSYYNGQQFYTSLSEKVTDLKNIKLFPNPANNIIYLTGISEATSAQIYDQSGRMIEEILFQGLSSFNFDITNYSTGTYIVRIKSESNVSTTKFIKSQ